MSLSQYLFELKLIPSIELAELERQVLQRLVRAGYPTSPSAVSALAIHLSMTLEWGRAISLTSIRTAEEAIERHEAACPQTK